MAKDDQGAELPPKAAERDFWELLAQTPMAWVFGFVALISAPVSFLSDHGATWFFFSVAVGASAWWWINVVRPKTARQFGEPQSRKYSTWKVFGALFIPAMLWVFFGVLAFSDVSRLNLWRKDYESATVRIARFGPVRKYFQDTAERTTPDETSRYEREEWIRWMAEGAKSTNEGAELLFIEAEPFAEAFRTFVLEVHDFDSKVSPCPFGAAFLVHDHPGDPWYRPVFRDIACDFGGDFNTCLFRITVLNANPGEKLWLFLCVKPEVSDAALDKLDVQLRVRP